MTATRVRTAEVMGTIASIHIRHRGADETMMDAATRSCIDDLEVLEAMFSPYRDGSEVSRIDRGELALADADALVREVADACDRYEDLTGGRFTAHWTGGFDPTGYVKGWAVERAARAHLAPLVARAGVEAVGINVGGDMQLFTADQAAHGWSIGIADPFDRSRVIAKVDVRNGAVATSGTAERGAHVIDPRRGSAATSVAGATVIADSLTHADVWATAALVAGDDLAWTRAPGVRSAMRVGADGVVRRWADGVELVSADPATAF